MEILLCQALFIIEIQLAQMTICKQFIQLVEFWNLMIKIDYSLLILFFFFLPFYYLFFFNLQFQQKVFGFGAKFSDGVVYHDFHVNLNGSDVLFFLFFLFLFFTSRKIQ